MTARFFPIERLRLFSVDGNVYRAFDHLIAARMGMLLLVPQHLAVGSRDAVMDGCPVPHEEIFAVLEYPPNPSPLPFIRGGVDDYVQQIGYLGIDPGACEMDYITPMVNGKAKVLRLVHPSGVRYAVVMP